MHFQEVTEDDHIALFHSVPSRMYQNDPEWIPHVVKEIEHVFDRKLNGGFQNGDAIRWVLMNRNYEVVGRIAAFYSEKAEAEEKIGGVGFYECIAAPEYAEALLTNAENWLQSKGMEGVDGPVNFGERHQFWGCKTWGTPTPIYQENYNPTYYADQFLRNGYTPLFESLTYEVKAADVPVAWLDRLSNRMKNKGFSYLPFEMEQAERFVEDYLSIASQAFGLQNRTVKIDKETIVNQLNVQKGVFGKELIWFAYHEGKPVGVVGFMLNWSGVLSTALQFDAGPASKSLKGFLVAIVPKYQRSGVIIGLLQNLVKSVEKEGTIDRGFVCGIAAHSLNVRSVIEKFNAELAAKHLTFRKYFDGRTVHPHPMAT